MINKKLILKTTGKQQKIIRKCLIKLQNSNKTNNKEKVSIRYMLWLHDYLSTGEMEAKN